ncbi:MAG: hypothetical protein R2825_26060 [Saprospiraceae bacterium]
MLRYNHIFWVKLAMSFCLVFFLKNGLIGQAWIIETPSGKLSTWIIQRQQAQPQKAELFFLNQTGQPVFFDEYDSNDNYLEFISPKGLRVITRKKISDNVLSLKNNPAVKDAVKWEVDFFDYLNNLDFIETGNYLVTWHLKTSKGKLSTEPVVFYFENKTN